jgi:Carboxypeptidase regulatory-like domain/Photosynthesis system II assembly factor YCF48
MPVVQETKSANPKMEALRKLVSGRLKAHRPEYASHPDADTLSAFAEQALSSDERIQVLGHIEGCRDCRDIVCLALPPAVESQQVLGIAGRNQSFGLRWGALAAMVAIVAILVGSTRRHNQSALYKSAEPTKTAPAVSAQLKTPADIVEMHALRDDRTAGGAGEFKEKGKVIPTPKHMTAKPAANFNFDQSDQVRVMPRSNVAVQNGFASRTADASASNKLDLRAPTAASGGAIGGPIQSGNAVALGATSGPIHGAAFVTSGGVNGTITDPSGAVIANATVTVAGPTGTRAVQSDGQGQFAFDRLTPGSYSVTAQARGFQTAQRQQIAVLANQASNLQLQLQVGATSETVEVAGAQQAEVATSAEVSQLAKAQLQTQAKAAPAVNRPERKAAAKNEATSKKIAGYSAGVATTAQWTLSPDGSVERSIDSGKTWQPIHVADVTTFRSLSSDGADVWVGGNGGALYHSADSGQTWSRVKPVANGQKLSRDVVRVDFTDQLNGALATTTGQTWITSDGGQTWTVH